MTDQKPKTMETERKWITDRFLEAQRDLANLVRGHYTMQDYRAAYDRVEKYRRALRSI